MKIQNLPSAFEEMWHISHYHLVIFLDYDGTLTPIVAHPEKAKLSTSMRHTVQKLASKFPVAIVSGRGLHDLQKLVALEGICYVGSHGLEIIGPEGEKKEIIEVKAIVSLLDQLESQMQKILPQFKGAQLERKRFSIAVHYRNVEESKQEPFRQLIESIGNKHKELKWKYGKKILELLPNVDWDKGKAVLWLLEQLSIQNPFPIYIGDDLTDEDAFRVIDKKGMTIVIAEEDRHTVAHYSLNNTEEVQLFLQKLIEVKK